MEGRSTGLSGTYAAFERHVSAYKEATLLSPRWRESFLANVHGEGVADPVLQRLAEIGDVEERGTPRIDSATGAMRADLAEYVVVVAAPDREAAEKLIEAAVSDDLAHPIRFVPL
jgi:hypothetical protein